jgi:2'-5' RNA ligase
MLMGFHFDQKESFAHSQADFSYWHRGRAHYAVWVIMISDQAIAQRAYAARRHLNAVLLPNYDRQLAKVGPFVIEIDGLDSFAGAPFLRVIDCDQGIAKLRACLGASSFEQFGFCYTPHLTIGLYGRSLAKSALLDLLGDFIAIAPLRFEVNAIHWVRYDASDIGGALQTLAEYNLEENYLIWKADAPFECARNDD